MSRKTGKPPADEKWSIPRDLRRALAERASAEGRSVSQVLAAALEAYLGREQDDAP